jgi:GAF domain-containing protein
MSDVGGARAEVLDDDPTGAVELHQTLTDLIREQAALRRVATLVASGAPSQRVFSAVCEEVATVLNADASALQVPIDGAMSLVAGWSRSEPIPETDARWQLPPGSLSLRVIESGQPARSDKVSVEGPIGEVARRMGLQSAAAAPVMVSGKLWGVLLVSSRREAAWAERTENRLAAFTDLIAIAISNADALRKLEHVAAEQAALRRVATLVAQGASSQEVVSAVAGEIGQLFDAVMNVVARHAPDGSLVAIASWSDPVEFLIPIGTRAAVGGHNAMTIVVRTGRPTRLDDYAEASGELAEIGLEHGCRASIAAPIIVSGRVWGVIFAANQRHGRFAPDAEVRLAAFTELVATALANAQAQDEVNRHVREQAALRRVATLVAQVTSPSELFSAVSREVEALFDASAAAVVRFEADPPALIIVGIGEHVRLSAIGKRFEFADEYASTEVFRTGRSGRTQARDGELLDGPVYGISHDTASGGPLRVTSAVASPLTVAGKLWGAISVSAAESLPPDTEDRLARFADIVATAIANADSRHALATIAAEQASLRRIATQVAQGLPPEQIFAAVTEEIATILGAHISAVTMVRYDSQGPSVILEGASTGIGVTLGTRWNLSEVLGTAEVYRTGRSARIDKLDLSTAGELTIEVVRHLNVVSQVATPIIVDGRLWGTMSVSGQSRLPDDTEQRMQRFTELVATAIANADSRQALATLAAEQGALRRIATQVAQGLRPEQIFATVSEEIAGIIGATTAVVRFDGEGTSIIIEGTSTGVGVPIGTRWKLTDVVASAQVYRTARSARVDDFDWSTGSGPATELGRRLGVASQVATPIVVDGRLWGAISVSGPSPLPDDTEQRLLRFTELVATAIANADSRQALATLAAEQGALRRIATQVAQGLRPEEIFATVSEEIAGIIGATTAVVRFEGQGPSIIIEGTSTGIGVPIGTRWKVSDVKATAEVYQTGRSARVDDVDWSTGPPPVTEVGRFLGIVSQVATPIIVEGHLWGAISVNGRSRLPHDTEQRMARFTELVATAIANAESKYELAASRRRIVNAGDEARRRIERNLHDGIQQGLIELTFRARALSRKEPDLIRLAAVEFADRLAAVSDELREVARGIHPTILSQAGLGPALRALARRSSVPTEVDVRIDNRLPDEVEAAAYYVASEALVNVSKHAQATVVELEATLQDDSLRLRVRDDGIGGVDPAHGSGVLGIKDRVEALGGSVSISSSAGEGTELSIVLPGRTDSAALLGPEEGDHG